MIPAVIPFTGLDLIFALSALIGGGLFLVRLGLLLFGIGHDGDISGGHMDVGHVDVGQVDAAGGGAAGSGHEVAHAGDGFRLLTVNGAMGFFMMFGLLGLALHRGSGVGEGLSIVGGFAGGTAMMALIAKMFQFMQSFAISGNLDYRGAIGQQATVYLNIPQGGTGQVEVCINNRLRVMDAVAEDKQPIKTGDRVDVIELLSGNTLVVRRR